MAKKPKEKIKVSWLIDGVESDEPPEWMKQHLRNVFANVFCGKPMPVDSWKPCLKQPQAGQ